MNIFKWQECLQSKQNCFYWLLRWWNIRKIWDIIEIVFTLCIGIKDDISSIANVIFSYLKNISCSAFLYCIPFYHISTTQVRDLFEMGDIGVLRSDYWPEINSFYIMIIWKVKNIYFSALRLERMWAFHVLLHNEGIKCNLLQMQYPCYTTFHVRFIFKRGRNQKST